MDGRRFTVHPNSHHQQAMLPIEPAYSDPQLTILTTTQYFLHRGMQGRICSLHNENNEVSNIKEALPNENNSSTHLSKITIFS